MKALLHALRRNVIAVVAVLAIATVIGLGVTRPGPIATIFASSASTSNPHETRGCDSDRGADSSDGKDNGRSPSNGCPPCPQQVGYAGDCDGDNDADDR